MSIPSRERRPRRLYLDTSAYLCVLLGEDGWERVAKETEDAEIVSSVLLMLESRRSLVRLTREGPLTPGMYQACMQKIEADLARIALRDLTLDLCASTTLPAVATPRSLDLAHLRTAIWCHGIEPLDRFVTMDASQEAAAKELGLPV